MSVRDRLSDLSDTQTRVARVKIDGRVARVRVPRNATPEQAVAIARQVAPKSKDQQLQERVAKHPVFGPAAAFAGNVSDFMTFGLGDEVSAGLQTVDPFNRNSGWRKGFGPAFNENLARQQAKDERYTRENPKSALVGMAAGAVLPALVTGGGSIPLTGGKGVAMAAAQGGAYGFGSAKGGLLDRAKAIPEGAAWGAGGQVVGSQVGKVASSLIGGKKLTAAQRALVDENVLLTPGMRGGKLARTMEDKVLGSIPYIDEIPKQARARSFASLRQATANRVLKPIGKTLHDVPELASDSKVGAEFAGKLNRTVYDAYDDSLGNMALQADAPLVQSLDDVVNNSSRMLTGDELKPITNYVSFLKEKLAKGPLTGNALKETMSTLRGDASALAGTGRGKALWDLADVLENGLDAQNGMVATQAYRNAREAVSLLKRYEGAASKAGTVGGEFGPTQLKQAATKRGFGTTDASIASGKAPMLDLANNAAEVMRIETANSGTPARLLSTVGLLGAPAAASSVDPTIAALIASQTLGYVPGLDRILQNMATKRPPGLLAAGRFIDRNTPALGLLGTGGALSLYGGSH